MKTILKALAAVVRRSKGDPELLVFRHPTAGVQLPKGTIEPNETVEIATIRELKEESGLELDAKPQLIGTWERIVGGGPNEDGPLETNLWSISILSTDQDLPDDWRHRAEGSPAEEGLIFEFFWLPINVSLPESLDPMFAPSAKIIMEQLGVRALNSVSD